MKKLLILIPFLWIAQKSIGQTIGKDSLICFTKGENDSNIKITEKIIEISERKDTIINLYEKIKVNSDTLIKSLISSNMNLTESNSQLSNEVVNLNNKLVNKDRLSDKRSVREVILGAISAILITIELNRLIK